jgi:hypothetical protein
MTERLPRLPRTYLDGLRDGHLNAFDMCVDMYTEYARVDWRAL